MQPITQLLYWNHLGHLLRVWRSRRVSEAHAHKVLRLYLGYEFTDLMDKSGRYPVYSFNEIRRRLCLRSNELMLDIIRRSRSFYVAGTEAGTVMSVSSPIWHIYDAADGRLFVGPADGTVSEKLSEKLSSGELLINNKINTTVGNSDELALTGKSNDTRDWCLVERDQVAARHLVADYFDRLERSSDLSQRSIIDQMMRQCMAAKDADGHPLTEAQALDLMHLMISTQLVPYFSRRQDFFSDSYMAHPEKRAYWMQAFVRRYMKQHLTRALQLWNRKQRALEQRQRDEHLTALRSVRPHSPHEWTEPDGVRYYLDPSDGVTAIPPDMPPRPSPDAIINPHTRQWSEGKTI